ncbi:MAG: Hsp20 family protein [Gammaproteobacteria bacterium]|nr:Hsp20 family protein [Gammaproteobacteria bacterium]MDP2140988.1 Hsp20 family protein [Gammaproteobacteria bacterium]MDP2349268.1 Hsp20 family protein [Gammaproteobacteria bacterium]
MRTFDFAPLYRSTIGFDHLTSLLDAVSQREQTQPSYPPYNIELLDKDQYRITMAVAGFVDQEIEIQSERQTLTVKGKKADDTKEKNFLHQGIAGRNFERVFQLADHVKVTGATLENGLLNIDLVRELPEVMKPRQIPVNGKAPQLIDTRAQTAA